MKIKISLISSLVVAVAVLLVLESFKHQTLNSKDLVGAWALGAPENRSVMIITDRVFSVATYNEPGKKFVKSYGGTWVVDGERMIQKIEWNSTDSTQVGKEVPQTINLAGNKLGFSSGSWERLDNGKPGELMGAWIITGNYMNDKVTKRGSPFYPRRTMKVLSGKYFHWIAYNVATKTFMNAGGGSYTTDNGKYTEKVAFFTKTPESVGKTLQFNYSFVDGDWRHKGEKSTGGPLDECWSKRETLEK